MLRLQKDARKVSLSLKVYVVLLAAALLFLNNYNHQMRLISGSTMMVTDDAIPANHGTGVGKERTTNATNAEEETETETTTTTDAPNATLATDDGCIPFIDSASNYDRTKDFLYRQSSKLPNWMKEYFDWHNAQVSKINSCNYQDYRYMVLRCSNEERKCGGLSDRIKSVPFFIALAAKSKRIFMIRWQRPTKLEEFLLPNEIDWSFPDWMYNETGFQKQREFHRSGRMIHKHVDHNTTTLFLEGKIQSFQGGSNQYYELDSELDEKKEYNATYVNVTGDWSGWEDYQVIFHDLWQALFEPAPPIAQRIKDRMASAGLVTDEFAASHYRAFYAKETNKAAVEEEELERKAENALNCASQGLPGHPIYFASDSQFAVQFARNMTATHPERKIVTFDSDEEALHLDKMELWTSGKISDFYPTFVDLLIMSKAKCMARGIGGFGMFASLISSDPYCEIAHAGRHSKQCDWTDHRI